MNGFPRGFEQSEQTVRPSRMYFSRRHEAQTFRNFWPSESTMQTALLISTCGGLSISFNFSRHQLSRRIAQIAALYDAAARSSSAIFLTSLAISSVMNPQGMSTIARKENRCDIAASIAPSAKEGDRVYNAARPGIPKRKS